MKTDGQIMRQRSKREVKMPSAEEAIGRWEQLPPYPGFEVSTFVRIRRPSDGRIMKAGRGKGWVRQVMLVGYGVKCLHILDGRLFSSSISVSGGA